MLASVATHETYRLLHGDALSLLRTLQDNSVQSITTSPPYYLLRDYGTELQVWGGRDNCEHIWGDEIPGDSRGGSGPSAKEKRAGDEDSTYGRNAPRGHLCAECGAWRGELGLEPTPDMFVDHLVMIFREARRVLREDGTFFLNIADTFAGVPYAPWGIKQKDLLGIPHRLVHALQADGWYWRSDGVWSKAGGNCPRCHYRLEKGSTKPEPAKDRFVRAHEAMFMLTKAKHYYFDDEAAKEAHSTAKRRDVFHLPSQSFRGAHYATMPLALAEVGVLAGTSEKGACAKCHAPYKRVTKKGDALLEEQKKAGGDVNGEYHGEGQKDYEDHGAQDPSELKRRILRGMRKVETIGWKPTCRCACEETVPCLVLDMFSGAATTGVAALKHGRRYLGLELIASNNTEIAAPRLDAALEARKQVTEIEYLPECSGIYHGKAEMLLHRVRPKSVRLILTDPPYNVSRENNFHTMGRTGINFDWDGDFDQEAWLYLADKALMPGGSIVIWNDWKVLGFVASVLEHMGYSVKRNLTWTKTNPMPRNTGRCFVQKTECGLWAVKPGGKWIFNRATTKSMEDGVFTYPVPRAKKGRLRHESKKPDGMFEEIVRILSNPGELVLDPFCGGGTTPFACERSGRLYIAFDESAKWVEEATLHANEAHVSPLHALASAGIDYVPVEDDEENAADDASMHQPTGDAGADAEED